MSFKLGRLVKPLVKKMAQAKADGTQAEGGVISASGLFKAAKAAGAAQKMNGDTSGSGTFKVAKRNNIFGN